MIKTHKQAEQAQARRVAAKKIGYAKAVRRWSARVEIANGNDKAYRDRLNVLPVFWG